MGYELDDIDRGILHALQENARDITIEEMGERVGVSGSTVRNRIERMEDAGIIRGYYPDIDYSAAGYANYLHIVCRVPTDKRKELAEQALGVSGVTEVAEILDSEESILIRAVTDDTAHLTRVHDELIEIGLDVVKLDHLRKTYLQPFDHFGADVDGDDGDGP